MRQPLLYLLFAVSLLFAMPGCNHGSADSQAYLDDDSVGIDIDLDTVKDLQSFAGVDWDDTLAFTAKKPCNDCGGPVPMALAKPCIEAFDGYMRARGFDDVGGKDTNIVITKTTKYTDMETFRGKEIDKFLAKAAKGKGWPFRKIHLNVRVRLGIYTTDYAKYKNDPTIAGRMGIFITTNKRTRYKGHILYMLDTEDTPDDPNAYDFGGIHP